MKVNYYACITVTFFFLNDLAIHKLKISLHLIFNFIIYKGQCSIRRLQGEDKNISNYLFNTITAFLLCQQSHDSFCSLLHKIKSTINILQLLAAL